ncbi:unnamed protein product [Durusdinium trenchii]|uniref:Uncharacterized protein n=1 Tax=Durusdinium trenchii TaxID=1381693 RepID=A0ABP0L0N8_9DINO
MFFQAANMSHHQFCFQQVGGRCKPLGAGEIVPGIAPATPEQIRASQQRRAEQRRALKEQCNYGSGPRSNGGRWSRSNGGHSRSREAKHARNWTGRRSKNFLTCTSSATRMMQLLSKFGATCAPVRWAGSEASLVSGAGALEGTRF